MHAQTPPPHALRIALVEDDVPLRDLILMPGLRTFGFACDAYGTASEFTDAGHTYDIVILDVGLPDANGFDLANTLRARSNVGIVMLTGRSAIDDRVRGLMGGADAYLAKPVDVAELAATLHSLGRRLQPPRDNGSEPGRSPWHLDESGWCLVSPKGRSVALNDAERRVLALLLAAPGRPVARTEMASALTTDIYDFDLHRLDMLVHRLRAKIADASNESLPLRAVRGAGYVMLP
ncbi:response regulator transcription factor [Luteibacter sp. CQ10]|uniref:response regulator transcription factor n=1 Tax=Luteibacter sp. CQ10 TaxID=2805821 RepID=UPI0034A1EC38